MQISNKLISEWDVDLIFTELKATGKAITLLEFRVKFCNKFYVGGFFDCSGMLSVCCLYFPYSTKIAVCNINYFAK